jgi:hypothetical protein
MSVLIKTITNLPEHCHDCPCHNEESGYCQADKEHRYSDYHPFWCPLVKISNKCHGRLIRFNDIQIITAPIAPIFKGDKVHYEGIAFLNQILEIPPVQAISVTAVEEMKRRIREHNEFSRDEIDEMYMKDVLKIIDECCGNTEADWEESEE